MWGCVQGATWLDNANAVVLLDEHELEVMNNDKARYRSLRKILIRNQAGNEYAQTIIPQSMFAQTTGIKAKIMTTDEQTMRKLRKSDIETFHYSPHYVLHNDATYDFFDMRHTRFPYVYEIEFEKELKSLLVWPDWQPQQEIPVLQSKYRLIISNDVEYNTMAINIDVEPTVEKKGRQTIVTWSLENIEPTLTESYMPPEHELQMALLFAPVYFSTEKYHGSLQSWDTFAQWYRELVATQYGLNEVATEKILSILADCSDRKQKIDKLFAFLQRYTRYVAIEPGLSGWQPHSSQSVYENRYGDCKDLSLFMISMLQVAGIKAYPALVKTREHGLLQDDFPSNQFNHVIAVVPMPKDTVWLECTSKQVPPDFVPDHYEGCDVFVVKEESGEIWRTPKSTAQENLWCSTVSGKINALGDFEFHSTVRATGNQGHYYRSLLYAKDAKDQLIWMQQFLSRYQPNVNIREHNLFNIHERFHEPVMIQIEGSIPKFAKCSANRLFFNPNIMMRNTGDDIPKEEERVYPIYLKYAYKDIDTLRVELPPGYELEAAPDSCYIEMSFADFQCSYDLQQDTLIYVRNIKMKKSLLPVQEYEVFQEFVKNVVQIDRSQFVFRKAFE
jgi:hypothetical protein